MSEDDELTGVRRAVKSESAFRTISEVAEDLDVPQHVLRFWESKFPQVKPLKRGGGRRYYRPEDIALLRRIRDLLYSEGYTIKGVQKLLREGGVRELPLRSGEPELDLAPQNHLPSLDEMDDGDVENEILDLQDDLRPQLTVNDRDMVDVDDDVADAEGEGEYVMAAAPVMPVQSPAVVEVAMECAVSPAVKDELRQILDELEQLRKLLLPR